MFFELIGTIVAGVATGLIFWAVNRTLKGLLPSWLGPVSAGVAMLLATISLEYSWFDRTASTLQEGLAVVLTEEESTFYRPWSYAAPLTIKFVAADLATMQSNPTYPNQRLLKLFQFERWGRTKSRIIAIDCEQNLSADLAEGVEFDADGALKGADWTQVKASNPVLTAACAGA